MSRGTPGPSVGRGGAHVLRGPAPCTSSGTSGQAGQSRRPRCGGSGKSGFTSWKTSLSMGEAQRSAVPGVYGEWPVRGPPGLGPLLPGRFTCTCRRKASSHQGACPRLVQEAHQCRPSCWPLCCSPRRACQLTGLKLKAVWNIPVVFALVSIGHCRLFHCWFGWGGIADVLGSV